MAVKPEKNNYKTPMHCINSHSKYFTVRLKMIGGPDSSASIVSGYGLHNWAIEVRSSAEAKGFFL
jgi:hypothetical protein